MGCQPSRLVFTGLLFEASHPGAGGTLLLLRPNKDPNPALPACQLAQVLPCTHPGCQVGLPPFNDGRGDELISEPDDPSH